MNIVELELTKLHGFRLLAPSKGQQGAALSPESLPQMLGARLGRKVGMPKVQPNA